MAGTSDNAGLRSPSWPQSSGNPCHPLTDTCGKQISRQTVAREAMLPAGTDVTAKQEHKWLFEDRRGFALVFGKASPVLLLSPAVQRCMGGQQRGPNSRNTFQSSFLLLAASNKKLLQLRSSRVSSTAALGGGPQPWTRCHQMPGEETSVWNNAQGGVPKGIPQPL
ncbi:hypothetical protein AV530_013691 [Patagioenas fasciata monilis]|uniref:Uncharacterized protein n=1 Tax=Patagioenas fasciata monilis TaxID=372326 RepID=A0A1V4J7E6_PATFA|nr:hypothetical protein AV530_013691 [Patagioenas fasciata monilis]